MILEPPVFRDQGLMFSSTCPDGMEGGRGLPQSPTLRDERNEEETARSWSAVEQLPLWIHARPAAKAGAMGSDLYF